MAMLSVIPRRDLRDVDTTDTYEPVPQYGEVDPRVVCVGVYVVLLGLGLAT